MSHRLIKCLFVSGLLLSWASGCQGGAEDPLDPESGVEARAASLGELGSFGFDEAAVASDGAEVQTLRLTLADAINVNDVRLVINYRSHVENGRGTSGYVQWKDGVCREIGPSAYGNPDITLLTGSCERNVGMDGSVEFVFPFTVETSFGFDTNNQVSGIWYSQGAVVSPGWVRLTTSGAGFDVTDPGPGPVGGLGSFSFDTSPVTANGAEVQRLRLTLGNAADVNDVRLVINYSSHVENGRGTSGYVQWKDGVCREIGPSAYGNPDITLLTGICERNVGMDGSVEFVFPFTIESSFGSAINNQVSGIWYSQGTIVSQGWRRLTTSGEGFDVLEEVIPVGELESFEFDAAEVASDGMEVQTLRLTLNNATVVNEARLVINYQPHVENGRGTSGYVQWKDGVCREIGPSAYGNPDITLLTGSCERNVGMDGSVEFVFPFTVESSFGFDTNNQVSGVWYNQGSVVSPGWVRLTTSGAGFDVVDGGGPSGEPNGFQSFTFDQPSVESNSEDVQTFRLVLSNAAEVDEVRFAINSDAVSENGRSISGYFKWTVEEGCEELGDVDGYGSLYVLLLEEQCERNVMMDGSVEFVFPLTFLYGFRGATNNQVEAIWYTDAGPATPWRRVTESGAGFDIIDAGPVPGDVLSFGWDDTTILANGEEVAIFRVTLGNALEVDEVRLYIPGYLRWTEAGGFSEYRPTSYNNDKLTLLPELSGRVVNNDPPENSVEFFFAMTFSPSFVDGILPVEIDKTEGIWYANGSTLLSWVDMEYGDNPLIISPSL